MTLICVIRSHLETIAESLTELAQDYDADSRECKSIMCAVDNIYAARDCLDDVGASE